MSQSNGQQSYKHGLLTLIAREAGVSVATVSKVVHGKPDVGRATRRRIEALLEEHGAVHGTPEAVPAHRFYAVFRDLDSPYTLEVVRGVVDAGGQAGLQVVVGTTMHRSIGQWLDACAEPGVLGMVLVISMMAEHDQQRVLSKHVPVVLIDPLSQPLPGVPSVGVTDWRGAYDAVGHLLQLGHRRIGIIAGRPHSPAGGARLHGYRTALHNAGIEYDAGLVRSTDFDYGESVTATTELLTLPERPTAIFATSDAQALGTLEAARALRISVPHDLSVVSFDGTSAAATASPPLTAVRQPFDELGKIATRLLTDMADGKPPVVDRFELATALTLRSSTTALIEP
jgi:DNA-binding LacI/PurR family transcriptional regulator